MKTLELSPRYKVMNIVVIAMIVAFLGFIIFLGICMKLNIDIEMSRNDYILTFCIFGFLSLVMVSLFFINIGKAFYDEDNKRIILISTIPVIKRSIPVISEYGFAIVYASRAKNKDKCTVALRSDGRFLLTIRLPKDTVKEELEALGIKEIETI